MLHESLDGIVWMQAAAPRRTRKRKASKDEVDDQRAHKKAHVEVRDCLAS